MASSDDPAGSIVKFVGSAVGLIIGVFSPPAGAVVVGAANIAGTAIDQANHVGQHGGAPVPGTAASLAALTGAAAIPAFRSFLGAKVPATPAKPGINEQRVTLPSQSDFTEIDGDGETTPRTYTTIGSMTAGESHTVVNVPKVAANDDADEDPFMVTDDEGSLEV